METFKKNYYNYSFFSNFVLERGVLIAFFITVCQFNLVEVGLLQSFYSFATAISEIPAGIIGDKVGRKNSLIIGNLLKLIGVGSFLIGGNFYFFSILMVLQGIGMAFVSGSDQALLFDNLKARKLEDQFIDISSTASSVIFLAAFLATIFGGWIQAISWNLVFIITLLAISCSIYFVFTIDDKETEVMNQRLMSVRHVYRTFRALNSKQVSCLIIGTALFEASYMCFFMLSQNFFLKFEISILSISILYAVSRLVTMIVYYLLPKVRERVSDKKLMQISFVLVPMIILIGVIGNKFLYIFMFLLISVAAHIAPSIYWGRFNTLLTSEYRATFLSMSSLIGSLILSVLYFFAGNILESNNSVVYFTSLVVVSIIGEVLIFFTLEKGGILNEADIL